MTLTQDITSHHSVEASHPRREVVTLRLPPALLADVRAVKQGRESVNEFVTAAVSREVRRRQALAAHRAIVALRDRVKARTGPHPDAVQLIRDLREGRGRDA